jgi:hypothetical protein
MGYDRIFGKTKMVLGMHFGACEVLVSTNTLQYSDYDQFESEIFDKEAKYKRHAEVFPEDCRRAFELGIRMASGKVPEPEPMLRFDYGE